MAKRKSIGTPIQAVSPVSAGRGFVSANAVLIDPLMARFIPHVSGDVMSPTRLLNIQGRFARRITPKK
jgi:hypothetical protein